MPTGHVGSANSSLMPSFSQANHSQSYNADVSAASILQSVKEQEAQFERLTRELEVERESVAHQLQKCKVASTTDSLSSITSTDESFRWGGHPPQAVYPEEEGADDTGMSSHLLDSCLRELEERGTTNFGEDGRLHNMDGSGLYSGPASYFMGDDYRHGNPNTSFDSHSKQPGTRGSMSSLQYQDMPNGGHPYSRAMEDARNSPRLNTGTPTRFNNSPYTNLPYNSPHQRLSLESGGSYSNPGMHDPYGHYGMHSMNMHPDNTH